MTLFDIIRNLQAIAAQEPSVRSVSDGDIYDALNAAVDIKYGVFHITQDTHTTNGDLDVWGLNLFYIDRLLDNGENRLSIQSAGITILENVLKRFADTFGAEYMNNIVYTPFTQRFKDNCAGVFCKISISTVMDNLCAEGGKIVLVKNQDKSIDITSNGRYNVTPDYGFSGLGSVDINVDVQGGGCVASEETKTYTANGTYTITPTSGDCISKATVTVNVPSEEPVLQTKSIDIAENGSYSLAPDAGVDGLSNVNINVDVPPVPITPNLQEKSIEITENGNTIITPADGYDGLSQVEVITNVLPALQSKTIDITENGSYGLSPDMDAGFVGLAGVGINVNVPSKEPVLQQKSIEIAENGSYLLEPDEGYDGLESAWIHVDTPLIPIPANLQEKFIDITENGNYSLEPDEGIDGLSRVDITVNVPSTPYVVPDGMKFEDSTLTTFPAEGLDFSQKTDFTECWSNCDKLTSFPLIDTSRGTNFYMSWFNCSSLKSFPLIDTNRGTNFSGAWSRCSSLTSFPLIDTSKGTDFSGAWGECSSLTSFPLINTSNGTNFTGAWNGCQSLKEFPMIDTANGTNFKNAWASCISLTSFPMIDVSNGTDFNNAWYHCYKLTELPLLNTSNGTDFGFAWSNCVALTEFPALDLSKGTNFSSAWYWCSALTTMPALDLSKGTNFNNAWYKCESLTTLGGFGAIKESISLSSSPNLTVESIMNVITQAADLNELGITGKTMTFGSTNLAKLTDAQKGVATSKGWSLA